MRCRHCSVLLKNKIIDLGHLPPSNAYLEKKDLKKYENHFPLRLYVCERCFLVQTEDFIKSEDLFTADYAYFSSTSKSFCEHAKNYVNEIVKRKKLNSNSFVLEIASNDGYLLENFLSLNIPCLGIEPTQSTRKAAEKKGIEVIGDFFSYALAVKLKKKKKQFDLIIGNNVYAHVPNINDFTKGVKKILKTNGIITLEFPHLLLLVKNSLFDTIYHEHFSYLSLNTVDLIFKKYGLRVFDVKKINTHGGSLRVYGCHYGSKRKTTKTVKKIKREEFLMGILSIKGYSELQKKPEQVKNELLSFLREKKKNKKKVIAYGAAAKGNTLLNYCKINSNLIEYICDASPSKQNKYLPGSKIPIVHPKKLLDSQIDYILILPWNLKNEIVKENITLKKKGVKFFTAINGIEFID